MPDDDLLSHGNPHTTIGAKVVSLLSSRWDQVVPTRYGRQANCVPKQAIRSPRLNWADPA